MQAVVPAWHRGHIGTLTFTYVLYSPAQYNGFCPVRCLPYLYHSATYDIGVPICANVYASVAVLCSMLHDVTCHDSFAIDAANI